jgi:hypothetical protein
MSKHKPIFTPASKRKIFVFGIIFLSVGVFFYANANFANPARNILHRDMDKILRYNASDHNIYTYFDDIYVVRLFGLLGQDELDMLELWKKSWSAYGWNPVILDMSVAKRHPRFEEYKKILSTFPTVNPKNTELACYYRWIAMEVVGGGFMSDIDVMNYGFRYPSGEWDWDFTTHQAFIPSFVSASKQEYQRIVDLMASFDGMKNAYKENGKPHMSDMLIFDALAKEGVIKTTNNLVSEDTTKLLTHWSHSHVWKYLGEGTKRVDYIRKTRHDPLWNPDRKQG